ncbi:MAG: hypothetical protein DRP95_00245 [Candidatus Latescibacterota bacterium]|nr:MAG: hypothetical protein DRP95_00245 [Candidatus Latescibacterota bacterium]
MYIDSISYELRTSDDDVKLRKACQDFAAIFLHYLFKAMRGTVPKAGILKESLGEGMYRDMWAYEVAKLASRRGIGIGEVLYRELKRMEAQGLLEVGR